MRFSIAKVLNLASLLCCLVVAASFLIFVLDQTSSASATQQSQIATGGPGAPSQSHTTSTGAKSSGVHGTIDEVAGKVTSPFSGITSGWSSEWVVRGVDLLLTLMVYGLGLSYLARRVRVRL